MMFSSKRFQEKWRQPLLLIPRTELSLGLKRKRKREKEKERKERLRKRVKEKERKERFRKRVKESCRSRATHRFLPIYALKGGLWIVAASGAAVRGIIIVSTAIETKE